MENINKENQPSEPNKKNGTYQHGAEKPAKEKGPELNTDNDNGFVSPSTEGSSNKGQGPAGEDL